MTEEQANQIISLLTEISSDVNSTKFNTSQLETKLIDIENTLDDVKKELETLQRVIINTNNS